MYKNFSDWKKYDGFSYGSGSSLQEWIVNPRDGQIGLFKDRKAEDTTDNISEKIASEIARVIGLPAAKVDLAIWENTRIGMISYKVNGKSENLIEGLTYISNIYPEYNKDKLIDEETGKYYSLEMILNSVNGFKLIKDLLKIFIFDFIIGNTDRHHSNWGVIQNEEGVRISPVYDNASSLCAYEKDEKIEKMINDKNWVSAQCNSKSKTIIRIDGSKKKITHYEFISYIKNNYYDETKDFVKNIKSKLTYNVIESLLDGYNDILSNTKIKFIKIFLKKKLDLLFEIYNV